MRKINALLIVLLWCLCLAPVERWAVRRRAKLRARRKAAKTLPNGPASNPSALKKPPACNCYDPPAINLKVTSALPPGPEACSDYAQWQKQQIALAQCFGVEQHMVSTLPSMRRGSHEWLQRQMTFLN